MPHYASHDGNQARIQVILPACIYEPIQLALCPLTVYEYMKNQTVYTK